MADLEYGPPDPEHEALAASLPQEWVKAAEGWYSMHGSGLVRNLLAGAVPLIVAAERERIAAEADQSLRDRMAAAEETIRAAEREKIAELADLVGAVYGDECDGPPEPFATLARTTLSATCTGCGETFADSETSEYLFATRGRMERLLHADGWTADPVLCPACQPEGKP